MNPGIIIAIVAGFAGLATGIVALFTLGAQRRKISAEGSKAFAEAAQVVVDSATKLLTPAEERAERLEKKLKRAEDRIGELETSLSVANRTVQAMTARLEKAQALLTVHNIPFPPDM